MWTRCIYVLMVLLVIGSCKKKVEKDLYEYGTVVDVEGNEYKTVLIGDQWWMMENLKVKKYRNGLPLLNLSAADSSTWTGTVTGAYCNYENTPNNTGLLYNYYAVLSDSNLAPEGWHIATDDDWKALERFMGISEEQLNKTGWRGSQQADQLRLSGSNFWKRYDEIWSSNSTQFSAMAGGCRLPDGRWSQPLGLLYAGFWWTNTQRGQDEACYRYMDYKSSRIFRSFDDMRYAFSIRCVKD